MAYTQQGVMNNGGWKYIRDPIARHRKGRSDNLPDREMAANFYVSIW